MNNILKTIVAATMISFVTMTVFAEKIPYDIDCDYLQKKITIRGEIDTNGDFVTIQILNKGKSFDDFEYTDLLYGNQCTVEDEQYQFNIDYIAETGAYPARLVTNGESEQTDFEVMIATREDLQSVYQEINDAVKHHDIELFKAVVNQNIAILTTDAEANDDLNAELDPYFDYVKEKALSIDQAYQNTKILNTFLLMDQLNRKEMSNINGNIRKLYLINDEVKIIYQNVADDTSIQKYFTEKMSGKNLKNLEDFDCAFQEALVLTAAKYATGAGTLQKVVQNCGRAVGIENAVLNEGVYRILLNNAPYADAEAFKNAYIRAVEESGRNSSGGGSVGGGASGVLGREYKTETTENIISPSLVKIIFEDIEGVDWASEAILALTDRGIIQGKEPYKFKPYDEITREEFVKILVSAMGYENDEWQKNNFEDVDRSDWFCSYVNIANEKGLVRGIGDGKFGSGMKITRQDMCVMLCNALKMKDVIIEADKLSFEDADEIEYYAREAVKTLVKLGAVNGVSETRFDPNGNATRAQAAKIVYAILEYLC